MLRGMSRRRGEGEIAVLVARSIPAKKCYGCNSRVCGTIFVPFLVGKNSFSNQISNLPENQLNWNGSPEIANNGMDKFQPSEREKEIMNFKFSDQDLNQISFRKKMKVDLII